MIPQTACPDKLRVCAVSYLNTVPLVWGMLHGPQQGVFDLSFALPAECADRLARRQADVGIVPAVELLRQDLTIIRGTGIASRGAVRSILLVSKVAPERIRTFAADSSSRTSVMLARILLDRWFHVRPEFHAHRPDLTAMLAACDAALLIGDPALRVDLALRDHFVFDLGDIWMRMTGLPMVFAVWAGHKDRVTPNLSTVFRDSYRFGMAHLDDIVRHDSAGRGITPEMAREYLTRNIVLELGDQEYEGLKLYLDYAAVMSAEAQPQAQ